MMTPSAKLNSAHDSQRPGFLLTFLVWSVFGVLAFLCVFASASSATEFSLAERSLATAWRSAEWSLLGKAQSLFTWTVLTGGFSAVLGWSRIQSPGWRVGFASFVFLAPAAFAVLTADLDKIVTWGLAVVATPFATFDFLLHAQDGEFYAEGHLFLMALGWWTLLWAVLLVREVFMRSKRPKPASQPAAIARG